jgi:hypothetical protein
MPPRLNRIMPVAGPEYYKSYTLSAPVTTHWRPATCEEYECDDFLYGFVLTVDENTELGQQQAYYVRHDRTRRCTEQQVGQGITKFVYPPGNQCFEPKRSSHRLPIGRPPNYLVATGDWRGNPIGWSARFRRPADWVDDFANHQIKIAELHQRG